MRAVTFSRFGGPEVLEVSELASPKAGFGEVVVRVAAATVNPTDTLMRAGKQAAMMTGLEPPFVAGMEFAGLVHLIGAGVPGFTVGQRVMGICNPRRPQRGAHAEFVVVPAASVAAVPDNVGLEAAAALPMNGITALMALDLLGLKAGQTLLVTGATGAVGSYVTQIGSGAGLVILAAGRDSDMPGLRQAGAAHGVPRDEGMVEAVRALYPEGVDGLLDAALLGNAAASAVRAGGKAVALRRSNPIDDPRLTCSYLSVLDGVNDTARLIKLGELARLGKLTPKIACALPPEQADEAHRLVETGGQRGRVVLTFNKP